MPGFLIPSIGEHLAALDSQPSRGLLKASRNAKQKASVGDGVVFVLGELLSGLLAQLLLGHRCDCVGKDIGVPRSSLRERLVYRWVLTLFGELPELDAPQKKPPREYPRRCNPGDVWQVGQHRFMIGDCRDSAAVARLMGRERAALSVTSPPYADRREYDEGSGFEPIPAAKYVDWFKPVQENIPLAAGGSFFLNIKAHVEDGFRVQYVKRLVLEMVDAWGWYEVDELVWNRPAHPGKFYGRLKNAWEPVYHFTKGGTAKCHPERAGTPSKRCISKSGHRRSRGTGTAFGAPEEREDGIALPSNVIATQVSSESWHDAAFPVDLPHFFVSVYSDPGDVVYEPFGGGGTTMVACEMLGRACRSMELSPLYGDRMLVRMEERFGIKGVRLHPAQCDCGKIEHGRHHMLCPAIAATPRV